MIYSPASSILLKVKHNIIANYAGMAWLMALQILTIPIYLKLLGPEQWGILTACMTVYALMSLLDAGMSQVFPREVAIRYREHGSSKSLADLFYGFERIYWILGLLGSVVIFISADFITRNWLNIDSELIATAKHSLMLLGLQFLFQFPSACFTSLLNGIQAHKRLNKLQVFFTTTRHITAALSLYFINHSIIVYQLCFLIVTIIEFLYLRRLSWIIVEYRRRDLSWNSIEMRKVMRFSINMAAAVMIGMLTVQIDRIILSKLIPIERFGYYVIASQVAMALMQISYPITKALYPEMCKLKNAGRQIVTENRKLLAILSLAIIPIASVFIMFSHQLMTFWLHNIEASSVVSPILSLLVGCIVINVYYQVAYINWLVDGNGKMVLLVNVTSMILILATLKPVVAQFGVIGAPISWFILNSVGYLIGYFSLVKHKKIGFPDALKCSFVILLMLSFVPFAITHDFGYIFKICAILVILLLSGTVVYGKPVFTTK